MRANVPTGLGQTLPYRVVVLGAGYAGVLAANRILSTIDRRAVEGRAVEVTVVNPAGEFTERIRLHEVAAGSRRSAALPMGEVLHDAARLHVGVAERIDPERRVVHGAGWSLDYDSLIYAVGSRTATAVPGSAVHAHAIGDRASADRLGREIAALRPGAIVTVVGGGLTGIETATEIAERHPELAVHLIGSGQIGSGLSAGGRRRVLAVLRRLGVGVREGSRVAEVLPGKLIFADGGSLPFSTCVWAASMTVPSLASDSGLRVDQGGRLIVDETLRSPNHPEIVGAGDAVAPPPAVAGHLRMSCAAALPLGSHAATVVLAAIGAAGPARPLSIGFVIQCLSLGRRRGLIQLVRPDDTARRLFFGGRAGARTKEGVCRFTLNSLRKERTRPGSYRTFRGPAPAAPAAALAPATALAPASPAAVPGE